MDGGQLGAGDNKPGERRWWPGPEVVQVEVVTHGCILNIVFWWTRLQNLLRVDERETKKSLTQGFWPEPLENGTTNLGTVEIVKVAGETGLEEENNQKKKSLSCLKK